MNDFTRFLLAVFIFLLCLVVIGGLSVVMLPILAVSAALFYIMLIPLGLIILGVGVFTFFHYVSRNEPDLGKSKSYKIKQGKSY